MHDMMITLCMLCTAARVSTIVHVWNLQFVFGKRTNMLYEASNCFRVSTTLLLSTFMTVMSISGYMLLKPMSRVRVS
jgi:hypothetical protein